MKKIIALILALLTVISIVSCASNGGDSEVTTEAGGSDEIANDSVFIKTEDLEYTKKWIEEKIEANEIFNFKYDGETYLSFIESWTKNVETSTDEDGNTIYDVSYTDGKVVASCKITRYKNYPAVDWVCDFVNNDSSDSAVISDIQALYTYVDMENPVLGYALGSDTSDEDFTPLTYDFTELETFKFSCNGGRSSQGYMPYFDLSNGEKGIVGAIGWSGQWSCTVRKIDDSVRVVAGMTKTKISLHAGENMRTPSIVLTFFTGDCAYGHNVFRRLMIEDYTAKDENGETVTELPLTINCWGGWGEETILAKIEEAEQAGFDYDTIWIDAGWHGDVASADTYDSAWYKEAGNWYFNDAIYDNGFQDISKVLKEKGKGLLVWFEPERVYKGTEIATQHSDYVIYSGSDKTIGLYNFADDEAAEYMTNLISNIISENGITWYRQDFNMDPLDYWSANDKNVEGTNRTGITEIKYITNLYKYIDTLREENPGLMMDNCSSGGKRLDIEMMKRSFPLWRSDYYCSGSDVTTNSEACRNIAYNLSYWIPFSCGGNSSDGLSSKYYFRCAMGSGMTMGVPSTSLNWWKSMIAEYKSLRSTYMTYDYYILTQGDRDHYATKLAAYEYYSPEKEEGCVLAFRSQGTVKDKLTVELKGLDPDATYHFVCSDNGEEADLDGYSAMNGGFVTNLSFKEESLLIYFSKVN